MGQNLAADQGMGGGPVVPNWLPQTPHRRHRGKLPRGVVERQLKLVHLQLLQELRAIHPDNLVLPWGQQLQPPAVVTTCQHLPINDPSFHPLGAKIGLKGVISERGGHSQRHRVHRERRRRWWSRIGRSPSPL